MNPDEFELFTYHLRSYAEEAGIILSITQDSMQCVAYILHTEPDCKLDEQQALIAVGNYARAAYNRVTDRHLPAVGEIYEDEIVAVRLETESEPAQIRIAVDPIALERSYE